MDPWSKKQLKKNEVYTTFGIHIDATNDRPSETRLTIYLNGETPEKVYMWIDCFGNEAAQITSSADIEKLLNNVISFVSEKSSTEGNLHVFGPSAASGLFGSDKSVIQKKIHLNNVTDSYKNEKCSLAVGKNYNKNNSNEFSVRYIEFYKGQVSSYPEALRIVASNDSSVSIKITCDVKDLTLSTSPSDLEKLLDGVISFTE